MGKPAASDVTLAPGAGHGDEGDASFQGPAQEKEEEKDQAQIEALPAQPKPTNSDDETAASDTPSSVIELAAVTARLKAAEVTAVPRGGDGQVTVRAKPEKRKNAKERAKERARAKGKLGATEEVAVTPEATSPETAGLSTAHPKPEKRKNAKERAKEKYAAKDSIKDRTTPDTTAKATSKVEKTTKSKAKTSKVAGKAA